MKIKESRIRQIIREEAKKALQEMPYAGSFEPRQSPDWELSDEERIKQGENPRGARKFSQSKRFKDLSQKHLANMPNNFWFAPLIGAMTIVIDEGGQRFRVLPLDPDGLNDLKNIGYNVPDGIKSDDVIINYDISTSHKDFLATPWMIFHAMFDSNAQEMTLCPSLAQLNELMIYNPGDKISDPDFAPLAREQGHKSEKWFKALTMASARNGKLDAISDAIAEMMCQELLTSGGLRLDLGVVSPEYHKPLHMLSDIIKQCANEFRKNIGGKYIIIAVN